MIDHRTQQETEALREQVERAKAKEIAGVVALIKDAIAVYGLTAKDLGLSAPHSFSTRADRAASTKRRDHLVNAVKAKYRDEAGNVWSGRGPRPTWLRTALAAGKSLDDFVI